MKTELYNKKGTIASVLSQPENSKAIFGFIEKGDLRGAKNKAVNILDNAESLAGNSAVEVCKQYIMKAKNASHFMSIMGTYMTGCKVS